MKKYEAPVVELEIFAVANVMDGYTGGEGGGDVELGEWDTPIS